MAGVPSDAFDAARWLAAFVSDHRGVRPGKMFGRPAAFAGAKLFACAYDAGLLCKLPDDIFNDEVRKRRGIPFEAGGRKMSRWILYRPPSAAAARRLGPILEHAARFVAEAHLLPDTSASRQPRSRSHRSR